MIRSNTLFAALMTPFLLAFSATAASQVTGTLSVDGDRIDIASVTALALTDTEGKPFTLVVLSATPIDLTAVLESDDPQVELILHEPLKSVTHALLFLNPQENYLNASKAGEDRQYSISEGLGLETQVSGGHGELLRGNVRTTESDFPMQIQATFSTPLLDRPSGRQ